MAGDAAEGDNFGSALGIDGDVMAVAADGASDHLRYKVYREGEQNCVAVDDGERPFQELPAAAFLYRDRLEFSVRGRKSPRLHGERSDNHRLVVEI